jgi:hypothetical protein
VEGETNVTSAFFGCLQGKANLFIRHTSYKATQCASQKTDNQNSRKHKLEKEWKCINKVHF